MRLQKSFFPVKQVILITDAHSLRTDFTDMKILDNLSRVRMKLQSATIFVIAMYSRAFSFVFF
jgi:hypothetical protein